MSNASRQFPRLVLVELDKAIRNRWFAISLTIALAIATWSAMAAIETHQASMQVTRTGEEWIGLTATSAYATWIVVGTGEVFRSGIFFFLMPLLVIIPYSWSLGSDRRNGYMAHQLLRCPREMALLARYAAAFITSGLVITIPLIANFIILLCFLPAYTPEVVSNLYMGMLPHELFSREFFTAPGLYVAFSTILDFVICGAWGGFVLACSPCIRNRIALIVGSFILTFVVRLTNQYLFYLLDSAGFNYSITDLLYHGSPTFPREAIPTAVVILSLIAAAFALLCARRKDDLL